MRAFAVALAASAATALALLTGLPALLRPPPPPPRPGTLGVSSEVAGQASGARTGAAPLLTSSCAGTLAHVLLQVGGEPFSLVVDTGSSNTEVAASACGSCAVSPKFAGQAGARRFDIAFGTGAVVLAQTAAPLSIGGLDLQQGSFGAIVAQNTSFGFNFFSPPEDTACYNSFAGLMGLAYKGQDAGPDAQGGGTTNGTTEPLLDQLVAAGMPNAFAIEICDSPPLGCDAHRTRNDTWLPSSGCGWQQIGSLLLGGYSSGRIQGPMEYTPITDEVHYDVQLLGARACGARGCVRAAFPDSVSGRTEDDCVCSSEDCAPGTVSYCSFAVVDSGTDAIYMNTGANARALMEAMDRAGLVRFPGDDATSGDGASAARAAFWFNGSAARGAAVAPQALLEFELAGETATSPLVRVPLAMGALFRETSDGLTQVGVSGNLDLLEQFQRSKFPTLLGGSFFQGRTILFDRSRKRIGFAAVREDRCRLPASPVDVDRLAADAQPTPGAGCRRGTGSGGGCNRGPWKAPLARVRQRRGQREVEGLSEQIF